MAFSIRNCDLRKLNSMTKYPSIPTYHALGEKGALLEQTVEFPAGEPIYLSEKIDGTNCRIILTPDDRYIIGSREELLYAEGDLIGNPSLGIVEALKPLADKKLGMIRKADYGKTLCVIYGELYGGKVTTASKQYTNTQAVGFRVFDVCEVPNYEELFSKPVGVIAQWRDDGGQDFMNSADLGDYTSNFLQAEMVPLLGATSELPTSIADTHKFLRSRIDRTFAAIDLDIPGKPEGIIARTINRSVIAKLRFEDYERHQRRLGATAK